MALDATVGGANSNAYEDSTAADAYFADRLTNTTWSAQTNKDALLVTATGYLDGYMSWEGLKTDTEQALHWPATGVLDYSTGEDMDDSIIPNLVKVAMYELAYYLISNSISYDNAEFEKIKVGPISIEFDENNGFLIPDHISRILSDLGTPKSLNKQGISTPKLERV